MGCGFSTSDEYPPKDSRAQCYHPRYRDEFDDSATLEATMAARAVSTRNVSRMPSVAENKVSVAQANASSSSDYKQQNADCGIPDLTVEPATSQCGAQHKIESDDDDVVEGADAFVAAAEDYVLEPRSHSPLHHQQPMGGSIGGDRMLFVRRQSNSVGGVGDDAGGGVSNSLNKSLSSAAAHDSMSSLPSSPTFPAALPECAHCPVCIQRAKMQPPEELSKLQESGLWWCAAGDQTTAIDDDVIVAALRFVAVSNPSSIAGQLPSETARILQHLSSYGPKSGGGSSAVMRAESQLLSPQRSRRSSYRSSNVSFRSGSANSSVSDEPARVDDDNNNNNIFEMPHFINEQPLPHDDHHRMSHPGAHMVVVLGDGGNPFRDHSATPTSPQRRQRSVSVVGSSMSGGGDLSPKMISVHASPAASELMLKPPDACLARTAYDGDLAKPLPPAPCYLDVDDDNGPAQVVREHHADLIAGLGYFYEREGDAFVWKRGAVNHSSNAIAASTNSALRPSEMCPQTVDLAAAEHEFSPRELHAELPMHDSRGKVTEESTGVTATIRRRLREFSATLRVASEGTAMDEEVAEHVSRSEIKNASPSSPSDAYPGHGPLKHRRRMWQWLRTLPTHEPCVGCELEQYRCLHALLREDSCAALLQHESRRSLPLLRGSTTTDRSWASTTDLSTAALYEEHDAHQQQLEHPAAAALAASPALKLCGSCRGTFARLLHTCNPAY